MMYLLPKVGGVKEEEEDKKSIWKPTLPQGTWAKSL